MSVPKRVLKTFDATSMVTGNMIGSGIFLLAGYAAAPVPNDVTLILAWIGGGLMACLLYTSPSPRDKRQSRMPSSA